MGLPNVGALKTGTVAVALTWPSLKTGATPRPLCPSADGQIWNLMEFHGSQWFLNDSNGVNTGFHR